LQTSTRLISPKISDESVKTPEYELPSRTTMLLEGTASLLGRQRFGSAIQNNRAFLVPDTPQSQTSVETRPRRTFGLAPWHRKSSHESLLSVSSSVHRILMGRAPAVTPAPEKQNDNPFDTRSEQEWKSYCNSANAQQLRFPKPGSRTSCHQKPQESKHHHSRGAVRMRNNLEGFSSTWGLLHTRLPRMSPCLQKARPQD
jgi:hypothetical protein